MRPAALVTAPPSRSTVGMEVDVYVPSMSLTPRLNVPPALAMMLREGLIGPKALITVPTSVPPLTTRLPENVLATGRTSVPAPVLVNEPPPTLSLIDARQRGGVAADVDRPPRRR